MDESTRFFSDAIVCFVPMTKSNNKLHSFYASLIGHFGGEVVSCNGAADNLATVVTHCVVIGEEARDNNDIKIKGKYELPWMISCRWIDACVAHRCKVAEGNYVLQPGGCTILATLKKRVNPFKPPRMAGYAVLLSPLLEPRMMSIIRQEAVSMGAYAIDQERFWHCSSSFTTVLIVASDMSCPLAMHFANLSESKTSSSSFRTVLVSPYFIFRKHCDAVTLPTSPDSSHVEATTSTLRQCKQGQLSIFLDTIHRPLRCSSDDFAGFQGCVFSTSGFPKKYDGNAVPTKYDVEAAIVQLGAIVGPGGMIEGISTHLVCLHNHGEKYEAAVRWGYEKIRIVSWVWLLSRLRGEPPESQSEGGGKGGIEVGGFPPTSGSQSENDFDFYASQSTQPFHLSRKRPHATNTSSSQRAAYVSYQDGKAFDSDLKKTKCMLPFTKDLPTEISAQPKCCFLLGGGYDLGTCKGQARTVLEGLGASVVWPVTTKFEPCTHLILWTLHARTEKFMCAVASGCWILRPGYIEASLAVGRLVAEQDFEWDNEDIALARAYKYRRAKYASGEHRLFSGKQFVIVGSTNPPAETLIRLVECGGGKASAMSVDEYCTSVSLEELGLTAAIATSSDAASSCLDVLKNLPTTCPIVTPHFLLDSVCTVDDDMPSTTDPKYDIFQQKVTIQKEQTVIKTTTKKVRPKKIPKTAESNRCKHQG